MQAWMSNSLTRYYPASEARRQDSIELEAARGERISAQVVFRTEYLEGPIEVTATANAPEGVSVKIRRVGYVPMPHLNTGVPSDDIEGVGHIPGLVPDPLFPENTAPAGAFETQAFWLTLIIDKEIKPGRYIMPITLSVGGNTAASLQVTLNVHPAVLPLRRDFPVTHWFYADALCDWYKTEITQEKFWQILEPYFANLTEHGQDTIYVPVFTPPLDGVKRPTQLLGIQKEKSSYQFDWSLVQRWVKAAKSKGLTHFEWTHLFSQWGAKYPLRIYKEHGEKGKLLWKPETPATALVYRRFLSQFLQELHGFLQAEGILEKSFFHVSDEPHGEEALANYRAARKMLQELAPWMKVMDALSDIAIARTGLIDEPIPSISVAPDFIKEGFKAWAYFCCGPRGRYLNRFLDTPLLKIRMSGWLFYRLKAHGFLHWGYNYWYKCGTTQLIDPFIICDAMNWPGWTYGDPFVVYPGSDGPLDSLRWEVFAESLQDYALIQNSGIVPEDPLLADIKNYADFPRREDWINQRRKEALARLDNS